MASCSALAAGVGPGAAAPLFFVGNSGQAPPAVRFLAKTPGGMAYFSPGETLFRAKEADLRVDFQGARSAEPEALRRIPGAVNFLTGPKEQWRIGLSPYEGIIYRDLYPGIDLKYAFSGASLKSEFVAAAGANPSAIRIRYRGAGRPHIAGDGSLVVRLGSSEFREQAPEVYQERAGKRVPVECRFALQGETATFEISEYDSSRPLIIDPAITYSTLLGGSGADAAYAIAVDAAGAAYIAGFTESYNLPTANPVRNFNAGGNDVFIAKLDASGAGLVYCTYLGGWGDDRAYSIAVDSAGAAYVTGSTTSGNFPLSHAMQTAIAGGRDAFVLKLAPSGASLAYSTYLGGAAQDAGNGIAVDSSGNAYVTGDTSSLNFPAGGLQKGNLGAQDAFAAKLSADGSRLVYSTYLGGGNTDHGAAIAVDSTDAAWVAGSTWSADFPLAKAFQAALGGGQDAFVARLAPDGNTLLFSTYLGGSGGTQIFPESAQAIALDALDNAYVAGVTGSANFPLRNPLQSALLGTLDAFAAKMSASGMLAYSTYLGGSGVELANGIAVDPNGAAYVAGYTYSTDLPIVKALQSANAGECDAFLAKLGPAGALDYLSYLGGNGADNAAAVAVGPGGSVYVAGWTLSSNFPVSNPYQATDAGNYGAFVTKVRFEALAATGDPASLASYLNSTSYIDFSGYTDISWTTFTPTYYQVGDGNLTLSFSTLWKGQSYSIDAAKLTVPNALSWNVTPYSQRLSSSDRLPVLDHFINSVTINFSSPVSTFGFEAAPAGSISATISATFYSASSAALTIAHENLTPTGNSRIFAATGAPITGVTVSTDGSDFALGAFRYALDATSPPSVIAPPLTLIDESFPSLSERALAAPVITPPAVPAAPAAMLSPADGATLPGAAVTFRWSAGSGVSEYWLYVSKAGAGGKEIYAGSQGVNTSKTLTGLPVGAGNIYVRLWSRIGGIWSYNDYSFRSAAIPAAEPEAAPAAMISPRNGATLSGSGITFIWSAAAGASEYWLYVSKVAASGKELYYGSQGLKTSKTFATLSTGSGSVYVRLWSKIGGDWLYTDCTYRGSEALQAPESAPAVMISPANGSVLPGSTATFTWSAGISATEYWLYLSRVAPGGKELYNGGQGLNHSKTLTGLPASGSVYVRLWSRTAGAWQYADFSYQASGRL